MSTHSPYLMLIAVLKDSRAERLEESDIVYVFFLVAAPPDGQQEKK